MSEYQFGRIENLPVRCGQPVLDPSIKIVRVARLGGQSREAEIPVSEDFELKQAVRDLLADLERLDNAWSCGSSSSVVCLAYLRPRKH